VQTKFDVRRLTNMARRGRGSRNRSERGAVLPLTALIFLVLLGAAGMAVDLGWLYWNSLELQHSADAAALGGVVYVDDNRVQAKAEATAVAAANGYVDTSLGGSDTVLVLDQVDDPSAVGNPFQLRATITHAVPTFFMKIFGLDTVDMARTAVAEYVLPLPLGSPEPYFGNDPELGRWPNFWGNIHGYYTGKGMGDRFASQCSDWNSHKNCTANAESRQSVNAGQQDAAAGYLYAVDVDPASAGSLLTVELLDPEFTRGGGDEILVGDAEQGGSPGPVTTFMLYDTDATPMVTVDGNDLLCSITYDPRDPYADFNGDGTVNAGDDRDGDGDIDFDDVEIGYPGGVGALWETLCTIPISHGGVYPLRVMISDPGDLDQRGLNRWSLRASTSGGPDPTVYGLGDMSIYANVDGTIGNTVFYLAEVAEVHAGKTLVIELWDPGDAQGNHAVEILDPFGVMPPCEWGKAEHKGNTNPKPTNFTSESQCRIATSGGKFNNWLVTIRVDLPDDYVCAADCWWKINYDYPGETTDTTTWSAYIEGNPVRLVE
jgi:Putative Flp pilus-assembly TadE/G-like